MLFDPSDSSEFPQDAAFEGTVLLLKDVMGDDPCGNKVSRPLYVEPNLGDISSTRVEKRPR